MRAVFIITCLIVLSPLVALAGQAAFGGSSIFSFLIQTVLSDVVINTLALTLMVGAGASIVGVSCAWFSVHYSFAGRRALEWMLFMPLAFPAYILAYVYTDFFDAAGPLALSLQDVRLQWLLPDMRNIYGAAFILTFCLYPYVYLFARNGFMSSSQRLVESGKLLGGSRFSQFFDIALPSARPFILVGLTLSIMELVADYGTMDYFSIRVFSTVIYDAWAGYGDIAAAAKLSIMLLGFVLLLVWAEKKQRHKMRFYAQESGDKQTAQTQSGNIWMTVWCAVPVCVGFVIPGAILLSMVVRNITASHVISTLPYLVNTLMLCFIVAVLGVSVSYILASYKRRSRSKHIAVLYDICGFGYALPGVILGLGLLLVSSMFSALGVLVTGTFMFLVLGYLVRFLNVALQGVDAGYEKISPSIDEAGKLMENSRFDDFWQVKLPLLTPALLSAGLVLAVEVIKELPLTLILRPFDFDTLAVHTYNLASDERLADAALPALCIVLAGCIPVLFLQAFTRRARL